MPTEAKLSPKAAERVAREATLQSFANAARAINLDWGTAYDGKQIERWAERLGQRMVVEREGQVEAYERGVRPSGPANDPALLMIGVDGGRVQSREKNPETGSRWREDKVLTITSCLPGNGHDKPPRPLVTTHLATMQNSKAFGKMTRVEAERRGIRQAQRVIFIGDGANWIDSLWNEHFFRHPRIIDYYHAVEHLYEVAKAVHPNELSSRDDLAGQLKSWLWDGQLDRLITRLEELAQAIGPPGAHDPPDHPRRTLTQNVGYFQRHRQHMNYPAYRAHGWPIASGITESGVKQFNRRVKGTDQFWLDPGAEAVLTLRACWLSQDNRWPHYWLGPTPTQEAA